MSVRRRSANRSPGFVYSGLSAALVVALAALTVTASQTAPPAIAELAPQAVQQIKDAPQEQSTELGRAEGGGGLGSATTTTTTTTTAPLGGPLPATTTTTEPFIERARIRRCVGNPPRQTEDPQSPPCVPFWEGDNGGSTYKGVTADSIRMTIPTTNQRIVAALEAYFNKRFEFYGRRLVLIQGGEGDTCEERKASAVAADSQNVFAGLDASYGNAGPCFQAEMARRKLISVTGAYVQFDEGEMRELAPYLWQYNMSFDKIMQGLGEMYCSRLADQNAVRSPDPLIRAKPRKLGVVIQNVIRDTDLNLGSLDRALAKCGARVAMTERLSTNDDAGFTSYDKAQLAMARFKTNDITTVVNLGLAFVAQNISSAADSQQYYPEWLFTSYGSLDWNLIVKAFWPQPSQRQSIMGIAAAPLMRPWELEPAYVAMKEVDPTIDKRGDVGVVTEFVNQYRSLLVAASGIQLAGPNLTPQTFAAGLERTRFPYPAVDPTMSGDVGFAGDHSMTDDFAEFWWSEAAKSPEGFATDGSVGAFCYLDGGARRRLGAWPTGGGSFFEAPCHSNG